jgi:hypothetical protein
MITQDEGKTNEHTKSNPENDHDHDLEQAFNDMFDF